MLLDLPLEILFHIIDYISIIDLYKLTKTCHYMQELQTYIPLWKNKISKPKYDFNAKSEIQKYLYQYLSTLVFEFKVYLITKKGRIKGPKILHFKVDDTILWDGIKNFINTNNNIIISNMCDNYYTYVYDSNIGKYKYISNTINIISAFVNRINKFALVYGGMCNKFVYHHDKTYITI